ncbi:MAG: response regulator, partial [Oscillatoriales cyanobacterium]
SPMTVQSYAPLVACIDDSVEICHQMQHLVTEAGYRCLTITDPLQAVSQLIEHQPQFILLDLVMPVIGGYELCKQLRRVKMFETIPIVVLTSRSDTIARLRSTMVGATGFLSKPLNPETVLGLLDHHFEYDIADRSLTALAPDRANRPQDAMSA